MAGSESRRRHRRSGGRGRGCCYCGSCFAIAVVVVSLLLNYYLCYSGYFGDCGKGKFGFIAYFLKENGRNFLAAWAPPPVASPSPDSRDFWISYAFAFGFEFRSDLIFTCNRSTFVLIHKFACFVHMSFSIEDKINLNSQKKKKIRRNWAANIFFLINYWAFNGPLMEYWAFNGPFVILGF